MIVSMTRYQFLLYHADVPGFLEHLRELGLVDITTTEWLGNDHERELFNTLTRYNEVARAMKSIKQSSAAAASGATPFSTAQEAVEAWEAAKARVDALQTAIERGRTEEQELAVWGSFDAQTIRNLKAQGVALAFYECSTKDFRDEWRGMYPLEVVNTIGRNVYFVIAQPHTLADGAQIIDIPAQEHRAPQMSTEDKAAEVARYEADQEEARLKMSRAALSREAIITRSLEMQEALDFSKATNAAVDYAQGAVKVLEGWSEATKTKEIKAFAESQSVVFTSEKAQAEQNPPIKLKNNFFARLYEPIGNLYMLPRYDELDMTPFFAPFFMIFFGMCLGDAGYGLLFILGIVLMWKKIPAAAKDIARLGLWLSLSGVVFGLLSGNLAGIEMVKVEPFATWRAYMVLSNPNTVFFFAIGLGAVQVLFGQFLRIINRIKRGGSFIYGVSSIGWFTLFISSIVAMTAGMEIPYVPTAPVDVYGTESLAYHITLGFAGILIIFFANPKANIFASAGKGLYSVYEMATGIVGDLISYVRLFAIGLAGAIIAQVFNELALGLSGDIIIVKQLVMLIILTIGHGLNIFISSLGAFVHPVRLTFVEFFKNAEFEGGGRKFSPLKKLAAKK